MTPAEVLARASADGLILTPKPDGRLNVRGRDKVIEHWRPALIEHKQALIAALGKRVEAEAAIARARAELHWADADVRDFWTESYPSNPAWAIEALTEALDWWQRERRRHWQSAGCRRVP